MTKKKTGCSICKKIFEYKWRHDRKRQFCSLKCIQANSAARRLCLCRNCGKKYIRDSSCKGLFCSMKCKGEGSRAPEEGTEKFMSYLKEKINGSFVINENGCHIWQKTKIENGYGIINLGKKKMLAHRAAWIILHGSIDPKLFACHSCDAPPCINAKDHIFLGTAKDNSDDCRNKGRRGSEHLTDDQVFEVRKLRQKGVSCREISVMFNVSRHVIGDISSGKSYKHVQLDDEQE